MWGPLFKVQNIIQKLRPLRVLYSPDLGFHKKYITGKLLKRKLKLIDLNLFVVITACVNGLYNVLSGNKDTMPGNLTPAEQKLQTQKMVLGAVFFTLFLTLYWICLVASWSFRYRSTEAVFMMNEAYSLDQKRRQNPGKYPVHPSKMERRIFGALLYNLVVACTFGLAAVTFLPLVSKNNPGHIVTDLLIPLEFLIEHPFLQRVIASAYLAIAGYFAVIPVIQAFTFITAVLYELRYILKQGYFQVVKEASQKFRNSGFLTQSRFQSFYGPWIIYAENVIFVSAMNRFGQVFYPGIMLTAFVINVVTSTVCIKFYHQLSGIMVALFLSFDVVVLIATWAVNSFAVVAKEESDKFCEHWMKRILSKLQRIQLRACIPLNIEVGPFFPLQRTTLLNTLLEVVNALMTLLLMN